MEMFDIYAEGFISGHNVYGAVLKFTRMPSPQNGGGVQSQELGTVRMSYQHLKMMAIMLHRQVSQIEAQLGKEIPIQSSFLDSVGVAPEDWYNFSK